MSSKQLEFREVYKRRKKALLDLALKKRIGEIPESLDGRLEVKQYEEPSENLLKAFTEYYELDKISLIKFVFEGRILPGQNMKLEFRTIFYNDDGSENCIASEPVIGSDLES